MWGRAALAALSLLLFWTVFFKVVPEAGPYIQDKDGLSLVQWGDILIRKAGTTSNTKKVHVSNVTVDEEILLPSRTALHIL